MVESLLEHAREGSQIRQSSVLPSINAGPEGEPKSGLGQDRSSLSLAIVHILHRYHTMLCVGQPLRSVHAYQLMRVEEIQV
jgi:hypothetical protein